MSLSQSPYDNLPLPIERRAHAGDDVGAHHDRVTTLTQIRVAEHELVLPDRDLQISQWRLTDRTTIDPDFGPWHRIHTQASRRHPDSHACDLPGPEGQGSACAEADGGVDQLEIVRAGARRDEPIGGRAEHAIALHNTECDRR